MPGRRAFGGLASAAGKACCAFRRAHRDEVPAQRPVAGATARPACAAQRIRTGPAQDEFVAMTGLRLSNVRPVLADGSVVEADVLVADGRIEGIVTPGHATTA